MGHHRLVCAKRDPQVGGLEAVRAGESACCHADYGEGVSVDGDRSSHCRLIPAEHALPGVVRDHGRLFAIVRRRKRAPGRGGDSQDVEHVRRDDLSARASGVPTNAQTDGHPGEGKGVRDDLPPCTQVLEVGISEMALRAVRLRRRRKDRDQPSGVANRQWPEEHRVEDAEQRDVEADPHGERPDRNG